MSWIEHIRAKRQYRIKQSRYKTFKRKQFNTVISENMISGMKHLAKELQVPVFVLTEHLLQIGFFHVVKIQENERKTFLLKDHLIETHLLSDGRHDTERILELGCRRSYIEEFLPLAAKVFKGQELLQEELNKIISTIRTSEETDLIKKLEDYNRKAMVELILWMECLETKTDSDTEEEPHE